jgi:hypothetical protein
MIGERCKISSKAAISAYILRLKPNFTEIVITNINNLSCKKLSISE